MMDGFRVLTVQNFGETEADNTRVTLSPMEIGAVEAKDDVRQGRPVKAISVLFKSGNALEFFVNEFDLIQIEQAVGMYAMPEY